MSNEYVDYSGGLSADDLSMYDDLSQRYSDSSYGSLNADDLALYNDLSQRYLDSSYGSLNADDLAMYNDLSQRYSAQNSGLGVSDLSKLFSGSKAFSGIAKTLGTVAAGKLADQLFGVKGGPGGYKGGIPTLTASRQMLPIPTTMVNAAGNTVPRRPGSGGISYFTPMQYNAPVAATTPANTTTGTTTTPVTPPTDTTVVPPENVAESTGMAMGGMAGYARGGIANLGSYSDGGRLLRGPGDGVSDSIPATIGKGQPARLADGEFVIPARIVSELGNGSTEAGARKLYAMMDRIKKSRRKAKNIAADTKSDKHLPA